MNVLIENDASYTQKFENQWHKQIQCLDFAQSVFAHVVHKPPLAETASYECMFTQTCHRIYNSVQISDHMGVGSDITIKGMCMLKVV